MLVVFLALNFYDQPTYQPGDSGATTGVPAGFSTFRFPFFSLSPF